MLFKQVIFEQSLNSLHRLIDKLGVIQTTILGTLLTVVVSVPMTLAWFVTARPEVLKLAMLVSIVNPILIAPPLFYLLVRLIEKIHNTNKELNLAQTRVDELSGLLPICCSCKKIRDDNGYWNRLESYFKEHSSVEFSHGICPECNEALYGDILRRGE